MQKDYHDITGKDVIKQAGPFEKALKESEERYRTLIELLPDAVFVFSKTGVEFANQAGQKLLGIKDLYELQQQKMIDFILPDDREFAKQGFAVLAKQLEEPFVSAQVVRADGTIIDVEIAGVALTFQGKDAIQVVMRDITGHKLAEKHLQEKEAHLRRITDNMLDIITQVDIYGCIQYVSPSVKKSLGYEPAELIGKRILNFVHPEDLNSVTEAFRLFIAGESEGKADFRFRQKEGTYRWLASTANRLFDDRGNVSGAIISTRDITKRMKLQKEMTRLDQLNLIGEMAAGIGHEIRNPMTTARGFLQLLRAKDECTKYTEYFDLVIEELDRANSIISEFLTMAKNKRINLKNQSLNSVVKALMPLIEAEAALNDKSVVVHLADIPELLLDEKEIRQLILNLVLNGLEAMDRGGQLTVETYVEDNAIVLLVKDEGKGIEPDSLEKLGTPFFTTKEKGTGLGLAICYSIAARHSAIIDVKTGPAGTAFSIKFKLPTRLNLIPDDRLICAVSTEPY